MILWFRAKSSKSCGSSKRGNARGGGAWTSALGRILESQPDSLTSIDSSLLRVTLEKVKNHSHEGSVV